MKAFAIALAVIALCGCGSVHNTLAQDLAWGRLAPPAPAAGVPHSPAMAAASAAAVSPTAFPASAPLWRRGFEWAYRYEEADAAGTYVWSVDRQETIDGVSYWVIRAGTREIFYRGHDLASAHETVDGVVITENVPPRLNFTWPLSPGMTWEQSFRLERPRDRQTTHYTRVWTVDPEETVAVAAGSFRAVRIVQRGKQTDRIVNELWYAPEVMNWVKFREHLTRGTRERELISYRLR